MIVKKLPCQLIISISGWGHAFKWRGHSISQEHKRFSLDRDMD